VGENIEYGESDPDRAFYLWLYENARSATCGFSTENGHRWGILTNSGQLGTGMSGALGVMDFSRQQLPPGIMGLISGAHYPKQAARIEAWANWFDGRGGPSAAVVVVDGTCSAMTLQRGSQTNGAWRAVLTGLEAGCHRYYFAFKDAFGNLVTYPTTGSLGIGGSTCADFSTERPVLGAGCREVGGCDPAPGGCDDGNPCTVDACEATGCTHVALANGTSCSDGDACNGAETRQSGACTPGALLACDDGNPCTADGCDATLGCIQAPLACDDANPCTTDACDAATGCTHANASTATACSDGLACNGTERCDGAGACVPGATCQDPPPPEPSSSGCGCGGGGGAGGLVLAAIALVGARPRRRRG
jgi:hypothetical protein